MWAWFWEPVRVLRATSADFCEAMWLKGSEALHLENKSLKKKLEAAERENRELKQSLYELTAKHGAAMLQLGRMEASTETPRKRKRSGEAGPSTDLVAAPKSSSAPRLRVSFGSVRVRTHDVEIWGGGGVPADDGPPLGLGWNVQGEEIFALDAFESERKGSRITKTKREERRGEDSRGEERS